MDNQISLRDVSSFSNYEEIIHTHIHTNLEIDFDSKKLFGYAEYTFKTLQNDVNRIVLDVRNLEIEKVFHKYIELAHKKLIIKENHPLGTPLEITLNHKLNTNDEIIIKIHFKTTEGSDAIQWLTKDQTLGKQYPYLFTQAEAILSRTMFPNQDTPSVKTTYSAVFRVVAPLVVAFSGILKNKSSENGFNTYSFEQNIPIPSYLFAFVSGLIEFKEISLRCGVYAEKEILDKSAKEFEDAETFIKTAEDYLTPYEWGRYDIVVLPLGFPYGGMENPNLTFVTPSLLAGDKSLVNVIAHEIAHSWTGNLVTNSNWQNFWLNEGFTKFLERKILYLISGKDAFLLDAFGGYDRLKIAISAFPPGHSFTSLTPNINDIDPDDAFSVVPYEKGFLFLYFIENLVGEANFRTILQKYINTYRLKSINYLDFKKVLETEIDNIYGSEKSHEIKNQIDWNHWVFEAGLPKHTFNYDNSLLKISSSLADKFISGNGDSSDKPIFDSFSTSVKIGFLTKIKENANSELTKQISQHLAISSGYNDEISFLWYEIALKTDNIEVIPFVTEFLSRVGRMKYLRSLYRQLYRLNKESALNCFSSNKIAYHPVASRLIEKDFNLN